MPLLPRHQPPRLSRHLHQPLPHLGGQLRLPISPFRHALKTTRLPGPASLAGIRTYADIFVDIPPVNLTTPPRLANHVVRPAKPNKNPRIAGFASGGRGMHLAELESAASSMSRMRSNQLSYRCGGRCRGTARGTLCPFLRIVKRGDANERGLGGIPWGGTEDSESWTGR